MLARIALACASLVFVFGLTELGMRIAYVESDGFGMTRAAQRWKARHWGEENRFGFRDREYPKAALESGRRYFAIGDSFTAGHGLERRSDRYAEQVARRLGPGWELVVMARNGWSSADQAQALASFPATPDLATLQVYPNDIQGAAEALGRGFDFHATAPRGIAGAVVARSDLLNFAYWRLRRLGLRDQSERYRAYIEGAVADPEIWGRHAGELRGIAVALREAGAPLVVVVFPNFFAAERSAGWAAKVGALFAEEGVPVLDLTPIVASRDPLSLVVNANDAHANAAFNAEIAERLWPLVDAARATVPGAPAGLVLPAVGAAP